MKDLDFLLENYFKFQEKIITLEYQAAATWLQSASYLNSCCFAISRSSRLPNLRNISTANCLPLTTTQSHSSAVETTPRATLQLFFFFQWKWRLPLTRVLRYVTLRIFRRWHRIFSVVERPRHLIEVIVDLKRDYRLTRSAFTSRDWLLLTLIGMATRLALKRSCFGWISTPVTTGFDVTKFDAGHWRSRKKVFAKWKVCRKFFWLRSPTFQCLTSGPSSLPSSHCAIWSQTL